MKRRGLQSPDIADALALTYARTVFPRDTLDWLGTTATWFPNTIRLNRNPNGLIDAMDRD
jgi:hypothetical protein